MSKSQQTIEGVFPDKDSTLEKLVDNYLKAQAAMQKDKDRCTTAYDAMKERMRQLELQEYKCYDRRYKVLMQPDDPSVKVKPVKESESSPYAPGNVEETDPPQAA